MQAGGRPVGTHRVSKQRDTGDRISKQLPDAICVWTAGSGNCVAAAAAAAVGGGGSRNGGGDGGGGGALGIAGGRERRGRR